ncbi:hypothetical protein QUF63_05185 [Anaerolineales bacterium HSG25]|nr:hypothetical protein [Anaerolineales bacterium HSG25]
MITNSFEQRKMRKIEQVDTIPLVLQMLITMGVAEVIDNHCLQDENYQGLSIGWLMTILLVYVSVEWNDNWAYMAEWVSDHRYTLECLSGQRMEEDDFSVARLEYALHYLNDKTVWSKIERELEDRIIQNQYSMKRPFSYFKRKTRNMLSPRILQDDCNTSLILLLAILSRAESIIEFVVRRALAANEETLDHIYDGNPKRKTARPSIGLILHTFRYIYLDIHYDQKGQVVKRYLTPLNQTQLRILELSGFSEDILPALTE